MNHPTDQVLFPGGFRRTTPLAGAPAAALLRHRLSQAASGQPRAIREAVAAFWSWEKVRSLAGPLVTLGLLRDNAAARRGLQRFLRTLGSRPLARRSDLAAQPLGTAVRIAGRAVCARTMRRFSHIWTTSEVTADNVRLLVEEGHDFSLADDGGPWLRIIAAGGYLAAQIGETIDEGDLVEAFGFVDRIVDPDAPDGPRRPRGEPEALALRAGDQLPLILRKIERCAGNEWSHTLR
jgi:hypothetical protein